MKNIITIAILLIATTTYAQNKNAKASMEVDGVCGMCKARIEKTCLNTKGVKYAQWDVDTHELKLIFDERKTDTTSIKAQVLAVGHDVKNERATDEAYAKVHPCCKYRDEDIKEAHEENTKS
ncbi:heavy-metal-associated domain-containing protein [Hyunsoonleella pacifica]|uniref:ATPase n=1 Tax=Hyunsoonleella pacifica TaxID=1080224 RepID=A0A4Q9FKM1_9FLAO|nr:cation transporter [Hyunsoonleella pacifica]TBN14455.1 ATPase [Hyunsoonleella pacifica]GGD13879.1 hypothetical protein GCM10011368_14830 [Hyunsoonleella pacifica]